MTNKSLRHRFVSAVADGSDATVVRPSSNWNDDHDLWSGYRNVTGTTDTLAHIDHLSLVTYNSAAAVAVGLPAPSGGNFPLGWTARLRNNGAGVVTITGTGGATINGASPVTLAQNDVLDLHSIGTTAYVGIKIAAPVVNAPVVQTFANNGTYTPTAGLLYAVIECIGGGGGGGGMNYNAAGSTISSGGGGSGGYSRRLVSAAAIGASQTVTVGAAGAAGTTAGANGGNGGFTSVGTLCRANGGFGGMSWNASNTTIQGGDGANLTSAVGDITAAGTPGDPGCYDLYSEGTLTGGNGGSSVFGGGGLGGAYVGGGGSNPGGAGQNYGAGGGGALADNPNPATRAGGAGAKGFVIITEFFQ